ncbi:MAG: filamentous hemagglutinin N-terminal domain-containing protein, partial [Janthinobacterium sp.]
MHNHAQHASVFILTPPFAPPLRRTVLALLMASCFGAAQANPALPQVVNGQATFNQQGNIFSITNTPNTIINWQSFSIHAGEITRFIQQNGSSAVLNRITGQDPSKILGSLESNGKVFLINPNGIVFGHGAKVDVNGLVASSLGMSNEDFLAGKHQFTAGSVAGGVSNAGVINAGKGGQVLLIAPNVENTGIITAPNGEVILAAGRSVQLADPGNPQLRVLVSAPSDQALNLGQIIAQGGSIGMAGALVGQRGVLNANSAVVGENGRIVLKASGKALLEAGSVTSATGAAGKGGEIRVLGEQVGMLGNAAIDASGATGGGTVLLGGDYQGKNADVQHARQVLIGKNVSVAADAVDRGDGGKVIVWGNDSAQVYGSISARGGAASGNGGLVETSGARALAVDGIRVDTRARSRSGKTGDWLLDPSDINVVAGSSGNGLQDAEDFSNVFPDASNNLDASLISGATSNVRLQASNNVTFMSDVNNLNAGVGLSVEAGNRISVNALIKTSNGNLALTAPEIAFGVAGKADVGGANISLLSNAIGGSIALNGTGGQLTGSGVAGQQFQLQADNMDLRGGIDAGGVTGAAKVTLSATSNARAITLGAKPGTTLGLSNEDLNAISSATLHIGSSGNSAGLTASQTIDLPVVGGTAGVKNLELETAGPLNIDAGVTVHQGGGSVLATMAGSGSLSIGGAGGLHADTVQLTADHMSLAGAAGSLSGNAVLLGKYTQSGTIDIGGNAADTLTALGLSEAELKTISAANINIGSTAFMGTLRVTGALNLSNLPTDGTLQLRSGADMRIGAALTLPGNLRVGAASGIAATAAVQVGETFTLDGGAWSQSAASLPIFAAKNFTIANGSFLRVYGGDGTGLTPYRIADIFGLQGIGSLGMGNHYVLAGDIDASGTVSWNQNTGFAAIAGGDGAGYAGTFDGAGHVIGGLQINAATSSATAGVGLFGKVEGGIVRNVVLQGGSVAGRQNVGALVGMNLGGTLDNVSSSATVTGGRAVGGLAGLNAGIVSNAGASGYVTGFNVDNGGNIGGLVGENQAGAIIDASYATGTVKGPREMIGGLVGNNQGRVRRSYATGSASGGRNIGGLVGTNGGSIDDAYASGAVGRADNADSILTQENMGGLVGESTGSVSHVFSSGAVHGDGYAGVGAVAGRVATGSTFAHGFYNADTSLVQGDAGSSSGLSSAAMKQQGSFNDFNFSDVWRIYDGYTTPMLKDFLKPLLVTASGGASSRVYDGMLAGFLGSVSYAGFLDGDTAVSGSLGYGNARNVGNYALTGLWSTKYDIDLRGATLAILPRALTVSVGGNKVYDAQLGFDNASFVLGNVVAGDTVRASGNVVFLDKNVGNGKAVHASGISLLDNSLGNYSLDATTVEGTASISARALTYGVSSGQNRIYDGSKQVNLNGYFEGLLGSDQVSIQGLHGYMSDKQVGNAKSVAYDVATGTLAGQDAGNYVLSPNSG